MTSPNTLPAIDIKGLSKSYPQSDIHALREFDLTLRCGEMVAVMGASGSGKTTLLNIIAALDRPTSGSLQVFGRELNGHTNLARYRAREIGIVFQSFNLFPKFTAAENVIAPMYEGDLRGAERMSRAIELLDYVGLADRARQKVITLSQGQQQRVAIARSLANEPRLLLADEPTGNLDSVSSRQVMDYLERVNAEHGLTLILVTHDPDIASRADRIVRIVDGRNANESNEGQ